jgi:thiamine-monophosphate kinase
VVTADAIVDGVHFLPGTIPTLVARKLLRANLSDLAAKAAEPFGYWLTVAWPLGWGGVEKAAFADGLAIDGALFGVRLLGGDTVSTPGPMTASITALGYAPEGGAVRRTGARSGDVVLVSGTIGDGWLGLQAARGELEGAADHLAALIDRYQLPQPRLDLRPVLQDHATACLDVSDGLLADLGHLAGASDVRLELQLEHTPLSPAARAWLAGRPDREDGLAALAAGGDDYELAFTVPEAKVDAVVAEAAACAIPLAHVGRVTAGAGLVVTYASREVRPALTGWRHG